MGFSFPCSVSTPSTLCVVREGVGGVSVMAMALAISSVAIVTGVAGLVVLVTIRLVKDLSMIFSRITMVTKTALSISTRQTVNWEVCWTALNLMPWTWTWMV